MAFWDNWFKTPCDECGQKFSKDELLEFEKRHLCNGCHDSIIADRRTKEEERAARILQEEEARMRLLDRPMR